MSSFIELLSSLYHAQKTCEIVSRKLISQQSTLNRYCDERKKAIDLLGEIVAYARETGHDWPNLYEAEVLIERTRNEVAE